MRKTVHQAVSLTYWQCRSGCHIVLPVFVSWENSICLFFVYKIKNTQATPKDIFTQKEAYYINSFFWDVVLLCCPHWPWITRPKWSSCLISQCSRHTPLHLARYPFAACCFQLISLKNDFIYIDGNLFYCLWHTSLLRYSIDIFKLFSVISWFPRILIKEL
jgi:hypothetical protein